MRILNLQSPNKNNTKRIESIDGWRALAALGVLWTHTWAITNFQSITIGKIDLFKSINIIGNGVHLFFVISGFCMYLIFYKHQHYSFKIFIAFIKKRWLRIAPAFYVACIIIGTFNLLTRGEELYPRLFYNFIFVQNYVPGSVISSPFWSLAVEWHFYIILPFILIMIKYISVIRSCIILISVSLVLNILHYNNVLFEQLEWWYALPGNLIPFMWGILLCFIITNNTKLPGWLSKGYSFLPAIVLANFGKALFSDFGLKLAGSYKWIFLSTGPAIMTLGFCWLMYISLRNIFIAKIIGNRYFSRLGKISYSFYLWHAFTITMVYKLTEKILHFGGLNPVALFLLTLILLLPVSYASYYLLESFYFRKKATPKIPDKLITSAVYTNEINGKTTFVN